MFEELLGNLKESVGSDVLSKFGIGEDKQEATLMEVTESVKYRVKKENDRGGIDKLTSLFSENENTEDDTVMASKMEGDMMWSFMNKLGLSKENASGLAATVLPSLLSKITGGMKKEEETNSGGGIASLLGGFVGGDKDNKEAESGDMIDTIKGALGGLFGGK